MERAKRRKVEHAEDRANTKFVLQNPAARKSRAFSSGGVGAHTSSETHIQRKLKP